MLMDEADAELPELARRQRQGHGLAMHGEAAAGVRLVEAGQDLYQGRLARAVLAEQAMDLARLDAQRGADQRPLAAERLREILDQQRRRGRALTARPRSVAGGYSLSCHSFAYPAT